MDKMKSKKAGDGMPVGFVITITILALSVGIILLFMWQYNWNREVDKDACHFSVVARATAKIGKFVDLSNELPLNCRTERVCFASGLFGSCPILGKSTSSSPIRKINVGDNKDKILDNLAEILYDDNAMMGEGKINFMPRQFTETTYCLFTSRIAIDPKSQAGEITLYDVLKKLEEKKLPSGQSYLNYIYHFNSVASMDPSGKSTTAVLDFSKTDYAVAIQLVQQGTATAWLGGGATSAVVGAVIIWATGPIGIVGILVAGGTGVLVGGQILKDPSINYAYIGPSIVPYTPETIQKFNCDQIETLS